MKGKTRSLCLLHLAALASKWDGASRVGSMREGWQGMIQSWQHWLSSATVGETSLALGGVRCCRWSGVDKLIRTCLV